MTRKDYKRAADLIVRHVKAIYEAGVHADTEAMHRAQFARMHLIAAFEAFFREDNVRFDPCMFRSAIDSRLDY